MKVSILIPIYNVERYVARCLRSVFEQSYNDIEYVLIDDCSSDLSLKIVRNIINEYPSRLNQIKLFTNEKNLGISRTRNRLLEKATGDYVYFIDSDDYIDLNAVKSLVKIVNISKADIVRSNYYICTNNSKELIENDLSHNLNSYLENAIISVNSMNSLWKLFIRRQIFIHNSLKFNSQINVCEDYLMTIKLFYYSKKIVDVQSSFYYYTNYNNSSITNNLDLMNINKINSLLEVISFLEDRCIFNQFKNAILYRMVISKQHYLLNRNCFNLDMYYKYFPESNSYWRHLKYGIRERCLFWLAEYKLSYFIKLYYKLSNLRQKSKQYLF